MLLSYATTQLIVRILPACQSWFYCFVCADCSGISTAKIQHFINIIIFKGTLKLMTIQFS